mmetsp:Transcript_20804/g.28871  ORF Transcript_20804/g.28871 Transcript_20804/m.28871 type:complete len:112 (-) Transcript_20804:1972-2307(-)
MLPCFGLGASALAGLEGVPRADFFGDAITSLKSVDVGRGGGGGSDDDEEKDDEKGGNGGISAFVSVTLRFVVLRLKAPSMEEALLWWLLVDAVCIDVTLELLLTLAMLLWP